MHNTHQSQTSKNTNVPGCSNPDLPKTKNKATSTTVGDFIKCLKRVIRDQECVSFGGGLFFSWNLKSVVAALVSAQKQRDALLLEAAPDLLLALQRIADMLDRDGNAIEMHRDELRAIARAAILKTKVKGE